MLVAKVVTVFHSTELGLSSLQATVLVIALGTLTVALLLRSLDGSSTQEITAVDRTPHEKWMNHGASPEGRQIDNVDVSELYGWNGGYYDVLP